MTISNVPAVRADIGEMLAKIRDVSNKTNVFSVGQNETVSGNKPFQDTLSIAKGAFDQVNHLQTETDTIRNAYVTGDKNVSMSQVVLASQKSKMAFEGLITVRNKILEAYKEVMSMQI